MNQINRMSTDYPQRLKDIYDPPQTLYYEGSLPNPKKKAVAIVGARNCSSYGRVTATHIGKTLAQSGFEIISGLAYGIDCAAQAGALEGGGKTYAIMGCGTDVCYPSSNRKLYEKIKNQGGILSEYPSGTTPQPFFFPRRNRIISGLADIVIVVEAKEKSGSLITADFALEQGKEVYAVPGRMGDSFSKGCNRLIAQGAGIFYDVGEFLKDMGMEGKNVKEKTFPKITLEKKDGIVYSGLSLSPKSLDEIGEETGLGVGELAVVLASLVRRGYIEESYKNHYIRGVVENGEISCDCGVTGKS